MLDHIVTTVEEKLDKGISFDDAMIEVHKSFGNKMTMLWNTGTEYGIFANGVGYKSLIEDKIKSLNKNYRRLVFKEFREFLTSTKTMLPYLLISMFYVFMYYKLSVKQFFLLTILIPFLEVVYLIISRFKTRKIKKSVLLDISMSEYGAYIFLLYNLFHFFNIYDYLKPYLGLYLLIITIVQMPFVFANIKVLITHFYASIVN